MRYVIGLDVGGTTMKGAVMDETGRIIARGSRETRVHNNLPIVIERMASLVEELRQSAAVPVEAVGIGFPGPFDGPSGRSIHSPNLGLRQVDVRTPLAEAIRLPLAFENDLRTATLGEAVFGAGKGVRHMTFVPIGTGIGMGNIIDGQLLRGAFGISGELGHVTVPGNTAVCNCGKVGCVETVASAAGIVRLARERLQKAIREIPEEVQMLPLMQRAGGELERLTAQDVAAAVLRGDPLAAEAWKEVCEVTGWAVSLIINLFNPQMVVIGGGVSEAGDLLLEPVRRSVERHVMQAGHETTRIVRASLGPDAGMLGAGALALGADIWSGDGELRVVE
ncbi:ROK family protein [Brevibacillus choshinensis]|uniref:ROK family protein n=1 Tax=Brevibacillus choshinensis TaxID=54911 RepID=A0ABX7FJZ2_BRECH|nr:ROK family protein [Brevibacillus choshinensis]QRG66544.1 ROK family protein [Brevibacillus choshinensis]